MTVTVLNLAYLLISWLGVRPTIQVVHVVVFNRGAIRKKLLTVHAEGFVGQPSFFRIQCCNNKKFK